MEASLVRRTPSTQLLVRICRWANNGKEEVHPPLGALGSAIVHVEETQRYRGLTSPLLSGLVKYRGSRKAISSRVIDEEMVKRRALCAILGRVVDKGLISDIVGIDLILKVRLRIASSLVDEGLHDLVLPNVVVCALLGVKVEVGLIVRRKVQLDGRVRVAQVNLREGEIGLVGNRLGILDPADFGTCWDTEERNVSGVGQADKSHNGRDGVAHSDEDRRVVVLQ